MTSWNPSAFAFSAFAEFVVLDMACFAPERELAVSLRCRPILRSPAPERSCRDDNRQVETHLRSEICDGNAGGAYVIDTVRNQTKVFLPHSHPLAVRPFRKRRRHPRTSHVILRETPRHLPPPRALLHCRE